MIHEEKQTKGRETVKELKSISGVTEVRRGTGKERGGRKRLSKNILTIPLQSCILLYYNTHVRARTHSLKKYALGESDENYYFHVVDDMLGGGKKKNQRKKKEQYSELAKASTSILKLSKRGGKRLGWG